MRKKRLENKTPIGIIPMSSGIKLRKIDFFSGLGCYLYVKY